jgi:peptidase C25-like protein
MLKIISFSFILTFSFTMLQGQMWNGTDTLFGNEWIDYDQSYFKIMVSEDGMYRLSKSALESAGVPANSISGARYQLFHMGEEVPVYVSTNLLFNTSDYIEFYGKKNRGDLDRFVYANPDDEMLNPEYSLVSDSSAYFLTWVPTGAPVSRFNNVSNDLNNLPSVESYYFEKKLANFFNSNIKKANSDNVAESTFDEGEGFGNTFANSHEITLDASNIYTAGDDASVTVRLATDNGAHELAISFNNNVEESDSPNGFGLEEYSFDVPASSLVESNILKVESTADEFDKTTISNIWLTYPRSFNFSGENQFVFTVKGGSSSKYLEIENFNTGGQAPVLYDITNNIRIVTSVESGKVKIKLPASVEDRTLILSSQATGFSNISATENDFTDYTTSDAQFIIISNSKLYNDGNGANFVNEYAQYRSTSQGGDYNTQVVEIQELYDQFAYGINRHFISIRNFGHYIKKEWDDPQYIFIIGKGRDFFQIRNANQLNGSNAATFAVPTFGSPGADNLLMGGVDSDTPIIPIGRIAVSSPEDIKNYLDKIQLMESGGGAQTIEDQLWKKRLLHLGGGGPNEQTTIKNHLLGMANIIENSKFGGEVTGFYKTSSDPIQIGDSDAIFNRINDGVSVLTFFGHSAVGTFDFNIDNPERYSNYGKYPLLFSLGCYSGNIHTSSEGVSERFVFLKDKGAIAFTASTGQGYVSALATFAKEYYKLMGEEMYGESIGKIMQQTIKNYENNQSFSLVTLKQQLTIHGDPAYRINPSQGPDYTVDVNSVSFDPMNITATMDSFTINFAVTNLGFGTSDSINIILKQQLPDGDILTIVTDRIKTPKFQNTLSYTVASFKKAAAGQNKLFIEIDVDNEVQESPNPIAELNNKLVTSSGSEGLPFYIFDDSARPVYPEEFAIVNNVNVILKASTSNALIAERKYIMEIDTTELFNSPSKISTEIIQGGGVIKWAPGIIMQDSLVYYWRVSPDSINAEAPYVWENSSFIYLANSSNGWNQSHYYQYQKDEYYGLEVSESGDFNFDVNGVVVRMVNKIWDPSDRPQFIWNFGNPASSVRPWSYFDKGVAIFVGDSVSGGGWINPPGGAYGSVNANSNTRVFSFPTTTDEGRENLINFLENVIQPNNYVVLFTVTSNLNSDYEPETWVQDSVSLGKTIFGVLESQGATLVRDLEQTGSVPYTFIYRKDAGVLGEDIAPSIEDRTDTEVFFPLNGVSGEMISKTIGPASTWESLSWEVSNIDNILADTNYIKVYGVDSSGFETTLIEKLATKDTTLSGIDAAQYPFLRLEFYSQDEVIRTSTDLDYWRVLYQGLPDAAINANELFTFKADTLQQGDQMELNLAIENISSYDMDSLLVKLSVLDQTNNEIMQIKRYEPLGIDGIINTHFSIDTKNLSDIQQLVMEVNPDEDQPERYHFNNFALKQFYVEKDKRNPLMDVTFDGVHIMDGDIVSPKPQIYISLKDENQFLSLSDTSLFKLFLKYPGQQVADNIPIESEWVDFFPDTGGDDNNKASIRLSPVFEADGIYELLVQAEDVTGNQSGDLDYKVTFEVITKSSISNVLNYPNPFSNATQFVYTLTGEEIPEYFKIQILTVSGKIVKEITQDEIGPLRVGTHRTDYRWDGTDEYGDRLANGVYLYRVVAKKMGGESYDAFDNGTNNMFKKGFGKLVIIR